VAAGRILMLPLLPLLLLLWGWVTILHGSQRAAGGPGAQRGRVAANSKH
jgi:hypothetical protein